MFDDLMKQSQSIIEAYKKMQEKQCMKEGDDTGGDGSAYNKYLLGKTGDLPKGKEAYKSAGEKLEENIDVEQDPDVKAWADKVKSAHPGKNLKFKNRIESGTHTTSAEVPGEDRSYGVWDHDERKGHVFTEAKDPCWKGYKMVGMKDKDDEEVPNCVKEN